MPYAAHRHGDKRTCGATTKVSGQSTVFVNDKLWSVDGDENTHINGKLKPSGQKIFIQNKKVIVHRPDTTYNADDQLHPVGGNDTDQGSGNTFAY